MRACMSCTERKTGQQPARIAACFCALLVSRLRQVQAPACRQKSSQAATAASKSPPAAIDIFILQQIYVHVKSASLTQTAFVQDDFDNFKKAMIGYEAIEAISCRNDTVWS
jgi:hypothetical protein